MTLESPSPSEATPAPNSATSQSQRFGAGEEGSTQRRVRSIRTRLEAARTAGLADPDEGELRFLLERLAAVEAERDLLREQVDDVVGGWRRANDALVAAWADLEVAEGEAGVLRERVDRRPRGGWITCGASHPDPEVDRLTESMRAAEGFPTGGGCGVRLRWTYAFRCVECGRWMHRDCIRKHFAESGDDRIALGAGAADGAAGGGQDV